MEDTPTVCIAGKNSIAVDGLKYIKDNFPDINLLFIANSTDNGYDGWQPSLKKIATFLNVKEVTLEEIYSIQNLIFLSLEYSEIVDTRQFATDRLYNIHFSALPKYKGMYTATLPLLNGDDKSGVTLHKIDQGIDTGDIIAQILFDISIEDTARDLYHNFLRHSYDLLTANINTLLENDFSIAQQSPIKSTYNSINSINFSKIDINFRKTAYEIHNQYRAYTFREYQMPTFAGWQIIKSEITEQRSLKKPKSVINETETYFLVSSIDYNVLLYKDYYPVFWESCKSGDTYTVKNVLRYIDDLNLKNENGLNGLIIATYFGRADVVCELIRRGADPTITDYEGSTAFDVAVNYYDKTKDDSIIKLLRESGD